VRVLSALRGKKRDAKRVPSLDEYLNYLRTTTQPIGEAPRMTTKLNIVQRRRDAPSISTATAPRSSQTRSSRPAARVRSISSREERNAIYLQLYRDRRMCSLSDNGSFREETGRNFRTVTATSFENSDSTGVSRQ
jgi:hypothetical protein